MYKASIAIIFSIISSALCQGDVEKDCGECWVQDLLNPLKCNPDPAKFSVECSLDGVVMVAHKCLFNPAAVSFKLNEPGCHLKSDHFSYDEATETYTIEYGLTECGTIATRDDGEDGSEDDILIFKNSLKVGAPLAEKFSIIDATCSFPITYDVMTDLTGDLGGDDLVFNIKLYEDASFSALDTATTHWTGHIVYWQVEMSGVLDDGIEYTVNRCVMEDESRSYGIYNDGCVNSHVHFLRYSATSFSHMMFLFSSKSTSIQLRCQVSLCIIDKLDSTCKKQETCERKDIDWHSIMMA